jgi:peptide-methionine (S)-S-oxide reductase
MSRASRYLVPVGLGLMLAAMISRTGASASDKAMAIPAPVVDVQLAHGEVQTAVFSGGCFWGVQAVFQHVKGVKSATSGYTGGEASTAHYETVSTGETGHAESVEVKYDPSKVTYGELLRVFFSVAHDPTELNRQGPDEGTQYRSMISYTNDEQKKIAQSYIAQLAEARIFSGKIVTEVVPLKAFYPAEGYHQDYAELHPNNPYIAINDAPKVAHLKQQLPDLYRDR